MVKYVSHWRHYGFKPALFALTLLACGPTSVEAKPLTIPNFGYTAESVSNMTAEEHLAAAETATSALEECNSAYSLFFMSPSSPRFQDEMRRNCSVAFGAGQYLLFGSNPTILANIQNSFKTRPDLAALYTKTLNAAVRQADKMSANLKRLTALSNSR